MSNTKSPSAPKQHIHTPTQPLIICDVWEDNFEEEFGKITSIVEKYKTIGMDTEFPGIVNRFSPNDINSIGSYSEMEYKTIKMNVDKLKVIQIGISFTDDEGYLPEGVNTWQFNFRFDLNTDEYAKDAIDLLSNSGIKFEEHASRGISPKVFAEYLIGSGLILNEDIKWVSFHGGFDFAYLLRMLIGQNLPDDEAGFYGILKTYFPSFYDVKYMIRDIDSMKGSGLSKIAGDLNVRRTGPQHQAGSDALLTVSIYFKLKEVYFRKIVDQRHGNVLYGMSTSGDENVNDYYYATPDYSMTMYNGFGMNNMAMMPPLHYQNDPGFHAMPNTYFNMPYNMPYNNFGNNHFMDSNKNMRKYDSPIGKTKSQK